MGLSGRAERERIDLIGRIHQNQTKSSRERQLSDRDPVPASVVAPVSVTTLVPACDGNTPGVTSPEALCNAATTTCPVPGEVRFWVFSARLSETGEVLPPWTDTGNEVCRGGPVEQAVAAAPTPQLSLEDFRSLPLPPGQPLIEPAGGNVLINVPTNVYVQAEPHTLTTTLLGLAVQVRATPVSYQWDFGDGTPPLTTSDPGAPYPELRVTHTYTERGTPEVVLTTAYTGEYSVAGGPWLPVPGQASVTSDPIPLRVLAGTNSLVADPRP